MASKETIDFRGPKPRQTNHYSLPLYQGCGFNSQYSCWSINCVQGFFKFNLKLDKQQGVNLIFQLCSSTVGGVSNCPIDIRINGNLLVAGFDPHICNFYDMVWSVPASMLHQGDNEIILTLSGGFSQVFMRYAIVDIYDTPRNKADWMAAIPDATLIGNVNLPGTHDSAAINTTIHTPYACHNTSITDQLTGGIRLLDVRLKVKKNGNYSFVTCHGRIGSYTTINEYQSFPSLLDECKTFLSNHKKETILMSLQVDDWSTYGSDKPNVLVALKALLSQYPIEISKTIPSIGSIRGKILLYSRIDDDDRFGTPIKWQDNTSGSYAFSSGSRSYKLYVQDKYEGLAALGSEQEKFNLVTAAFGKKKDREVVLNFASATWCGILGVYIMGKLLDFFGGSAVGQRPVKFGWTLFDYEFEKYKTDNYGSLDIVTILIASNFNYSGYEKQFKVTQYDEL